MLYLCSCVSWDDDYMFQPCLNGIYDAKITDYDGLTNSFRKDDLFRPETHDISTRWPDLFFRKAKYAKKLRNLAN